MNTNNRILFVHTLNLSKRIGGSVRCHELAHNLCVLGHTVEMLVPSDRCPETKNRYSITPVRVLSKLTVIRLLTYEIALFFCLFKRCLFKKHTIYVRRYLPGIAPILASKLLRQQLIIEENGFGFRFHSKNKSSLKPWLLDRNCKIFSFASRRTVNSNLLSFCLLPSLP